MISLFVNLPVNLLTVFLIACSKWRVQEADDLDSLAELNMGIIFTICISILISAHEYRTQREVGILVLEKHAIKA